MEKELKVYEAEINLEDDLEACLCFCTGGGGGSGSIN